MLIRSRNRDRSRGGSVALSSLATGYLNGVTPYHWLDFINNRALYAGADVGNVTGATGYSFTRASDGYYTNSDGTLTNFASGALRRGDRGVLIEGSRTNLCLRSQEFDNASWNKIASSITANAIAAPDGTLTADKLVENSATTDHYISQVVTTTAAAHTMTVYAKAAERNWVALLIFDSGGVARTTYYDIQNGVIGTVGSGVTASIQALANGWYLCRATIATALAGATTARVYLANGDTVFSYAGDGTSGVHIWQADYQLGAFPSSPIVTVAAAATRAADVLTYTAGVTYPIQLWSEFERAVDTGADETILQMRGSANERALMLGANGSNDVTQVLTVAGGVVTGSTSVTGAVPVLTVQKIAGRIAVDDFRSVRNGTLGTLDSSGAVPTAPTEMQIGHQNTSTPAFGYIRRIAVIQGAGTDAQLQSMTGS